MKVTLPNGETAEVVKRPQPEPPPRQPNELASLLPFIEQLRQFRQHVTTAPTFTPKSLLEQIQFYDDEATPTPTRRVYFYLHNGWHFITLT